MMAACTYKGETKEARLPNGIICGHAYTVLSAHNLATPNGSVRLIKLRNPWGGSEWNGDWSDKSSLWTQQLKNEVGFVAKEDGIFFMAERDYLRWYE